MDNKEEWKPIKNYETLYEVSTLGNVRSIKGKIKKLQKRSNGYLYVGLSKNGKSKTVKVHRLVAEAYIDNPDNKPIVNHINSNRSDNRVDNLEWVTASENMIHSHKKEYKCRILPSLYKDYGVKEEWKNIKGSNGMYLISNRGEIKNVNTNMIRKPNIVNGYLRVRLTINGKRIGYSIHRLVAETFIDNPHNLPVVNHIDGNKLNNNVTNLEWCTHSENTTHSYKLKRKEPCT